MMLDVYDHTQRDRQPERAVNDAVQSESLISDLTRFLDQLHCKNSGMEIARQ
jgi:hypothetical protein